MSILMAWQPHFAWKHKTFQLLVDEHAAESSTEASSWHVLQPLAGICEIMLGLMVAAGRWHITMSWALCSIRVEAR